MYARVTIPLVLGSSVPWKAVRDMLVANFKRYPDLDARVVKNGDNGLMVALTIKGPDYKRKAAYWMRKGGRIQATPHFERMTVEAVDPPLAP